MSCCVEGFEVIDSMKIKVKNRVAAILSKTDAGRNTFTKK